MALGTGSQGTEGCSVVHTTQEPSLSLNTQSSNAAQPFEEAEDKTVQQAVSHCVCLSRVPFTVGCEYLTEALFLLTQPFYIVFPQNFTGQQIEGNVPFYFQQFIAQM